MRFVIGNKDPFDIFLAEKLLLEKDRIGQRFKAKSDLQQRIRILRPMDQPTVHELSDLLAAYNFLLVPPVAKETPPSLARDLNVSTKIFTGLAAQGSLGSADLFVETQAGIIESAAGLRNAALANLVPFVNGIQNRLQYDIKIVSSVTSRDGFKQTGAAQKVLVGYNKKGAPKYKTLVNRFAVMHLFMLSDTKHRFKVATLTLGPTDAAKLHPDSAALRQLNDSIAQFFGKNVTPATVNIQPEQTIEPTPAAPPRMPEQPAAGQVTAATPIVQPAAAPPPTASTAVPMVQPQDLNRLLAEQEKLVRSNAKNALDKIAIERRTQVSFVFPDGTLIEAGLNPSQAPSVRIVDLLSGIAAADVPPEFLDEGRRQRAAEKGFDFSTACAATSLAEWFPRRGMDLPPVEERSRMWEGLGLGPRTFYTGTGEQNMILLGELKRRAGC